MKFGLQAQQMIITILQANGCRVKAEKPNSQVDKIYKIDFWVERQIRWVPIQFTIDHQAVIGRKGVDALHRGICPCCLDGQQLEKAFDGDLAIQKLLVAEFWRQIEAFLAVYPDIVCRRPEVEALAIRQRIR
jgi:hypothetical protein